MGRTIIWTNHAIADLNQAFLDLLEESKSLEMTIRIFTEIEDSTNILSTHHEIYALDDLRKNNDGSIRSYEKHTYRISYQIAQDTIYIIRLRYARKEPLRY